MSLVDETMVVNLQVGAWTGHRADKQASADLTKSKNADSDAARVNKHLVPKEALAPIVAAAQALRRHLYAKTLPWRDNGDRLLTRALYADFLEGHGDLEIAFNKAVKKFIRTDYPKARDIAEFRMGKMFNVSDYPPASSLARRFYVHLDIEPVASAKDFRVQIGENEVERVRSNLERANEERVQRAQQDIWIRLSGLLETVHDRISTGKQFRASTVDNLREFLDIIPGLNFTGDENLADIAQQIKANVASYDPEDLRKNEESREIAATEAGRIIEEMKGFMNAFGGMQNE